MANKDRRSFLARAEAPTVLATKPIRLQTGRGLSVTIRLDSGSLGTSTFKLQASDLGEFLPEAPPTANDWVDIAGATVTWAGATVRLEVVDINASWVRVVFTDSGSAAPLITSAFTVRHLAG